MRAPILLLLLGVSIVFGAVPNMMSLYGPVIPSLGCDRFAVVPPNPNLFPSPDNYYHVFSAGDGYGFSSGEIYTNQPPPGTFMNVADGEGFLYWNIQNSDLNQWSPAMGTLFVVINLYSNSARTNAYLIGHGNITSDDFLPHNTSDDKSPHGWVVTVGGNVTLSYDIIPSAWRAPAGGSFTTTVFRSRTVNLYFPPNKNMWPEKETFTNRFFSRADAATFAAPLFDSTSSQNFWNPGTMTAYTATYSNVIQLWGANGFNFTVSPSGAYTGSNVGIDVALGLNCTGLPPVIHVTPPPPCPTVPDCTGCTTHATVSGICSQATATTQASCLTFTVDDTVACSPTTSSVQV